MRNSGGKRRARPTVQHGEDHLEGIQSISIKLETGKTVKFSMAAELAVSTDPDGLVKDATRAAQRYGFWAAQTARALARVRALERSSGQERGARYMYWYQVWTKGGESYNAHNLATASVTAIGDDPDTDGNKTLENLLDALTDARESYNLIRSIRDALDKRIMLLNRILAHDHDATHRGY